MMRAHALNILLSLTAVHCVAPTGDGDDSPADETGSGDTDTDIVAETGHPTNLEVTEGGVVICASPADRASAKFDGLAGPSPTATVHRYAGGGSTLADFTGDDVLDIVSTSQTSVGFFRSEIGEPFNREVIATRPPMDDHGFFSSTAADYDGDADLDLFVTHYGGTNLLLQNDGTGSFTDVTDLAGLAGPADARSTASAWADIDADGDLDLFVGAHGNEWQVETFDDLPPGDPSGLFENQGDGTFIDRSSWLPQSVHNAYTFLGGFHDVDNDGDMDLYTINDFGQNAAPNQLIWNNGPGAWVGDNDALGLDAGVAGMGLAAGFLNDDEYIDFAIPAWGRILLFTSANDVWFESAAALGVGPRDGSTQEVAWASEFADLDNDGDQDLLMAFGYLETHLGINEPRQPDAVFIQQEDDTFKDEGAAWDFELETNTRSFALGDWNSDGWLDVVQNSTNGKVRLFASRCGDEAWLRFRFRSPGMNRFGVGTKVEVFSGSQRWIRVVTAGGTGFAASGPPEVHVGLGDIHQIDRVVIHWPDGTSNEVGALDTRQLVTFTQR